MADMTDVAQRMTGDFAWAQAAPAVQQNSEHFGKLVAVYDRRVLACGRDRQTVVERAATHAGVPPEEIVVVLVPRPGLWEIPR